MSHRDRSSRFNLLFKQWDYRTIASQYISKADCHKLCLDIFREFLLHHCSVFIICMGIQNRQLFRCPLFDHTIKGLDDHLAQTLARSHNIRRIDRLIRADQNKSLAAVHHRRIGRLIRSDRIVFDGFAWAVFHQWHMFMSSCMVHHLWPIRRKYRIDSSGIPNGTNQDHQIQIRVFLFQFLLNIICIVFINIKHDQLFRLIRCDLTTESGSNASASSGHHHLFAMNKRMDLFHIYFDRLPSQQLLHVDIPQSAHLDLSSQELIHARQVFQLTSRLFTDIQNISLFLCRSARYRYNDLVDLIAFHTR